MNEFVDSEVSATWSALGGADGTIRQYDRYAYRFQGKDADGYDVYYVQFMPPPDTADVMPYLNMQVVGDHWDFWAAFEAWLMVEGDAPLLLARGSKETNVALAGDAIRFLCSERHFNDYYNGRRIRFAVRTGNNIARVVMPFDMWVDRKIR